MDSALRRRRRFVPALPAGSFRAMVYAGRAWACAIFVFVQHELWHQRCALDDRHSWPPLYGWPARHRVVLHDRHAPLGRQCHWRDRLHRCHYVHRLSTVLTGIMAIDHALLIRLFAGALGLIACAYTLWILKTGQCLDRRWRRITRSGNPIRFTLTVTGSAAAAMMCLLIAAGLVQPA